VCTVHTVGLVSTNICCLNVDSDSHMIMTALMVMLSSNWHSRDFSICQQFHRSELAYHTALQDPPHNIQPFSLVTYVG
jgi:hypothetical protein